MTKSKGIKIPVRVDEEELAHLKSCIKRAIDGFQLAYDALMDMGEVNKESDPMKLPEKRTKTFSHRNLILHGKK